MTQRDAMRMIHRITYRPGWALALRPVPDGCLTISCRALVIDATASQSVAVTLNERPSDDYLLGIGRDYIQPREPRLRHEPDPLGAVLGAQRTISLGELDAMDEAAFLELVREFLRMMEMHELDEFLCLDGEPIFDPHDAEQRVTEAAK